MRAYLQLIKPQMECAPIRVRSETIIGRAPDSQLKIASKEVSRKHCRLAFQKLTGTVLIEDLGSSNGTFVDGNRLTPHEPLEINAGCRLSVGPAIFEIVFQSDSLVAQRDAEATRAQIDDTRSLGRVEQKPVVAATATPAVPALDSAPAPAAQPELALPVQSVRPAANPAKPTKPTKPIEPSQPADAAQQEPLPGSPLVPPSSPTVGSVVAAVDSLDQVADSLGQIADSVSPANHNEFANFLAGLGVIGPASAVLPDLGDIQPGNDLFGGSDDHLQVGVDDEPQSIAVGNSSVEDADGDADDPAAAHVPPPPETHSASVAVPPSSPAFQEPPSLEFLDVPEAEAEHAAASSAAQSEQPLESASAAAGLAAVEPVNSVEVISQNAATVNDFSAAATATVSPDAPGDLNALAGFVEASGLDAVGGLNTLAGIDAIADLNAIASLNALADFASEVDVNVDGDPKLDTVASDSDDPASPAPVAENRDSLDSIDFQSAFDWAAEPDSTPEPVADVAAVNHANTTTPANAPAGAETSAPLIAELVKVNSAEISPLDDATADGAFSPGSSPHLLVAEVLSEDDLGSQASIVAALPVESGAADPIAVPAVNSINVTAGPVALALAVPSDEPGPIDLAGFNPQQQTTAPSIVEPAATDTADVNPFAGFHIEPSSSTAHAADTTRRNQRSGSGWLGWFGGGAKKPMGKSGGAGNRSVAQPAVAASLGELAAHSDEQGSLRFDGLVEAAAQPELLSATLPDDPAASASSPAPPPAMPVAVSPAPSGSTSAATEVPLATGLPVTVEPSVPADGPDFAALGFATDLPAADPGPGQCDDDALRQFLGGLST